MLDFLLVINTLEVNLNEEGWILTQVSEFSVPGHLVLLFLGPW